MTVRTSIVLGLALALVGCKKDKKDGSSTGSGSAVASGSGAAPPVLRPSQGPLKPLEAPTWPDDPKRAEKIALGHALFFDKRLSGDGTLACYSCHQNEDGNGGHDPLAVGAGKKVQPRHSPVIWNVAYYDQQHALYWDGRAKNLEELTKAAWGGGNMGVGKEPEKLDAKAAEMAKIKGYDKLFAAAFPDVKPGEYKADQVASALGEYQRTLICKDTAYDKFAGGDKTALSEQQQKGLDVFMGKGQCTVCHAPPHFSTAMVTDGGFYQNAGVGTMNADGTAKPEADVDVGRMKVSNKPDDWAAFKPPSLRNVSKSAPYFHDGSVAKFEDAVTVMAKGGIPHPKKSALLRDNALTAEEIADMIAFLRALDCPGTIDPPADAPR
jgi:cytochrome c peroxidase